MFVGLLLYMGQKQNTAQMYFTPKLYIEGFGSSSICCHKNGLMFPDILHEHTTVIFRDVWLETVYLQSAGNANVPKQSNSPEDLSPQQNHC